MNFHAIVDIAAAHCRSRRPEPARLPFPRRAPPAPRRGLVLYFTVAQMLLDYALFDNDGYPTDEGCKRIMKAMRRDLNYSRPKLRYMFHRLCVQTFVDAFSGHWPNPKGK